MVFRVYIPTVDVAPPQREAWMMEKECEDQPLEKFFPDSSRDYSMGKDLCRACPVKLECLAWIMSVEDSSTKRYGLFGDHTPEERKRLQVRLDKLRKIAESANKPEEENNE